MNLQLIHIEQLAHKEFPAIFKPQKSDEYEYVAIAIENEGHYYYWARGVSLEIERWEYQQIQANPKLYYFSTALKLHFRIGQRLKVDIDDGL